MRFPFQEPGSAETTDKVLQAFGDGASLGLRNAAAARVRQTADALPWHAKAFYYEGHAMGVAGRSAMRLQRYQPERIFDSADFRVMRFVGYGFWNGAGTRYPAPRLRSDDSYWIDCPWYPKYRPLIYNGFGFATVMFRGILDDQARKAIEALPGAEEREAAYHGVGRVLWFLYMNNFQALRTVLDAHPEQAEALGLGLGLAMGFTQASAPDRILQAVDHFRGTQREYLLRGVGIALEVHSSNSDEGRFHIESAIDGELRRRYEQACQASTAAGNGAAWYTQYHGLTRIEAASAPDSLSATSIDHDLQAN